MERVLKINDEETAGEPRYSFDIFFNEYISETDKPQSYVTYLQIAWNDAIETYINSYGKKRLTENAFRDKWGETLPNELSDDLSPILDTISYVSRIIPEVFRKKGTSAVLGLRVRIEIRSDI